MIGTATFGDRIDVRDHFERSRTRLLRLLRGLTDDE
jgi:hypothetical protein